MAEALTVEIHGARGAGKTTLLHIIGLALQNQGYAVHCVDEGGRVVDALRPVLVTEPRPVFVLTMEGRP